MRNEYKMKHICNPYCTHIEFPLHAVQDKLDDAGLGGRNRYCRKKCVARKKCVVCAYPWWKDRSVKWYKWNVSTTAVQTGQQQVENFHLIVADSNSPGLFGKKPVFDSWLHIKPFQTAMWCINGSSGVGREIPQDISLHLDSYIETFMVKPDVAKQLDSKFWCTVH